MKFINENFGAIGVIVAILMLGIVSYFVGFDFLYDLLDFVNGVIDYG